MKSLLTALLCVTAATVCQARLGETQAQIADRYGKPLKEAKPITPASSAGKYTKGNLGLFIGFLDGKAVYESLQVIEDDGDWGEEAPSPKIIDAFLKSNDQDGEWTEAKDSLDGFRHFKSATGKLIGTYSKKHHSLTVETAEFEALRKAAK